MPQDRQTPGTPEDWLTRAEGDLALAKAPLPKGAFYEDLCFHAQQAAEKAIKAVYLSRGVAFRYTHDLDQLLSVLAHSGVEVPERVREAINLTVYAWEARYPGLGEPVTEAEWKEAVEIAEQVVVWAKGIIAA